MQLLLLYNKSMRPTLILFLFIISLPAFGKVTPIGKKKFKPRPANKPVRIIYKNKSDFDFIHKDICHITLKVAKKPLKSYHEALKADARKCGANGVIITMAKARNKKMLIKAVGIRIYSLGKKLGQTLYDQIILAINNDKLDTVKVLLEKVDKRRGRRAPSDSLRLDSLFYIAAEKGLDCNPGILQIFSSYESILAYFDFDKGEYKEGIPNEKLIYCGNALSLFFPDIKNKASFMNDLNKHYNKFLLKSSKTNSKESEMFKIMLGRYQDLFVQSLGYLNETCSKNNKRKECAFKIKMKKNLESTNKMIRSI